MIPILDLPEVRRRISRLSVEEYHRLDEFNENGKRTEFIRGIVFEKMSKSPLHATIATRLFKTVLRVLPAGFTARMEQPLTLADSEPEPDISVVRGQDSDFKRSHPMTASLVVEIAVSSPDLDRELAELNARVQAATLELEWKQQEIEFLSVAENKRREMGRAAAIHRLDLRRTGDDTAAGDSLRTDTKRTPR